MGNPTSEQLTKEILGETLTMTLAIADENGPWAAPVVFINPENYDICWVSLPDARHSVALQKDPRAALTIVAADTTKRERALQISARVEKLAGPNLSWEQMLEAKRGRTVPQKAGEILEKGHEWYRAVPDCLYLLHTELYGFDRKRII